ncbi:hypothetical protein V4Y02_23425, partial [Escherichia coli]
GGCLGLGMCLLFSISTFSPSLTDNILPMTQFIDTNQGQDGSSRESEAHSHAWPPRLSELTSPTLLEKS